MEPKIPRLRLFFRVFILAIFRRCVSCHILPFFFVCCWLPCFSRKRHYIHPSLRMVVKESLAGQKTEGDWVCVCSLVFGRPFLLLDWGVCHAHWNSVMRSPMCRLSKTNTTPNVFWIRSAQRDHLAPLVARLPLKLCVSDTCPPLAFFLMECGGLFRSFFFFPPSLTTKKNNKLSFLI